MWGTTGRVKALSLTLKTVRDVSREWTCSLRFMILFISIQITWKRYVPPRLVLSNLFQGPDNEPPESAGSSGSSFGETVSVDENKSIDEVTLADSVEWEWHKQVALPPIEAVPTLQAKTNFTESCLLVPCGFRYLRGTQPMIWRADSSSLLN